MSRAIIGIALFVLTIVSEVVNVTSVSCKDMAGKDVDWFYVYKLPKIKNSGNILIERGVAFFYLDSNRPTFQLSTISIEDLSQPLAFTLQQIYGSPGSAAHLMYNDQPPDGKTTSRGHTKGVVAYDRNAGIWMVHSVPKFPVTSSAYQWPGNAYDNGQSLLCVSFNSDEMEKIANQMLYTYPYVYSNNINNVASNLQQVAPTFKRIVKGEHVTMSPWYHVTPLQSSGKQNFRHYGKARYFDKDLYTDFVAEDLRKALYVETWRRRNILPSDCTHSYDVFNVLEIKFSDKIKFSYTKDHSKWALSDDGQVICIGDINREESQFKRGGGTLCADLPIVGQQFGAIVSLYEPCK